MNYRRIINFLIIILLLIPFTAYGYTVSGTISDAKTGEKLSGVGIFGKNSSVVSNSYGYYAVTSKRNKITLNYSFIGFEKKEIVVNLHSDTVINIVLSPLSYSLQEITVKGGINKNSSVNTMGTQKISITEIKKMPALAGEVDVLRSLQSLPGIAVANEGTNSFSVRGGSYDQNLIILDEAVLYNPNHALSFISTFNPDAVQSAEIIKSAFPAKYGGRLSSVVDIRMREGNNQDFKVNGGIGLISSRLSVEGPLKKGESSFIVSGRYSNAGSIANMAASLNSLIPALSDFKKGNEVSFYDLNAKTNFRLGDFSRLFISAYSGSDHFYLKNFSDNYSLDWGNNAATVRLNKILSPTIFSNTTLAYSHYSYSYYLKSDVRNFLWKANMSNLQFKDDVEHTVSDNVMMRYGFSVAYLHISPGSITPYNEQSVITAASLQKRNSIESAIYWESEIVVSPVLTVKAGCRLAAFSSLGPLTTYSYHLGSLQPVDSTYYTAHQVTKTYLQPEPRLVANYKLSDMSSLKLSYSKVHQNIHLLSNSNIGMPTDIWTSVDRDIAPESSDQFSAGYYRNSANNMFEAFVEVYSKKMDGTIDFINNADIFMNNTIASQIKSGVARSYGVELFVKKNKGKIKGSLSYTLSKAWNKIDGINNDQSYPAAYDKRHNLKLMLYSDLNSRYTLSR
ncbi:MAG: TonB-dependent receptor [Bacteroidota bacterium]|nr:TonB-dependent receptor [Bacteroidota bacterium]